MLRERASFLLKTNAANLDTECFGEETGMSPITETPWITAAGLCCLYYTPVNTASNYSTTPTSSPPDWPYRIHRNKDIVCCAIHVFNRRTQVHPMSRYGPQAYRQQKS